MISIIFDDRSMGIYLIVNIQNMLMSQLQTANIENSLVKSRIGNSCVSITMKSNLLLFFSPYHIFNSTFELFQHGQLLIL